MHTAPGMRLVTRQRELYFAGYSRAVPESAEGPGGAGSSALCLRSLWSSRAGGQGSASQILLLSSLPDAIVLGCWFGAPARR